MKDKVTFRNFYSTKKKKKNLARIGHKSLARNKMDKKDFNCIIGGSDEKC